MSEWETPRTVWSEEDPVSSEDLDRIEGNTLYLYESAVMGRALIAAALRHMNRSVPDSTTFTTLIAEIGNISKDVYADKHKVLAGKTFYAGGEKKTGEAGAEVLS